MTVSDLVTRGIEAHNGGSYAKATSYFLMALLGAGSGDGKGAVPGDRFKNVKASDLATAPETKTEAP
jgi:hypothetical protein